MAQNLYGVIPALVTPRAVGRDEPDLSRLKELAQQHGRGSTAVPDAAPGGH